MPGIEAKNRCCMFNVRSRAAYVAALAALVLPGGSIVLGALWLYRYIRVQSGG